MNLPSISGGSLPVNEWLDRFMEAPNSGVRTVYNRCLVEWGDVVLAQSVLLTSDTHTPATRELKTKLDHDEAEIKRALHRLEAYFRRINLPEPWT